MGKLKTEIAAEGRDKRISFYVFNLGGGRGCGSYFQDPIQAGQWIHVAGVADSENTYLRARRSHGYRRREPITSRAPKTNPPMWAQKATPPWV